MKSSSPRFFLDTSLESRIALRELYEAESTIAIFRKANLDAPRIAPSPARCDNTGRCYDGDQRCFLEECVKGARLADINDDQLIPHLEALAAREGREGEPVRATTVQRAVYAINKLYWSHCIASPTRSPNVRSYLRQLLENDRRPQRKAPPLYGQEALALFESCDGTSLRSLRDRALFAFLTSRGFRASTVVGLLLEDLEFDSKGVTIVIHRDKTHKSGKAIKTSTRHEPSHRACAPCSVKAYVNMLNAIGINSGPLFRPVNRWDQIGNSALSPAAITRILRSALEDANAPEGGRYSSHSFRHGAVCLGVQLGLTIDEICQITLHRSHSGILPYISSIDPWYFAPPQIPLDGVQRSEKGVGLAWLHRLDRVTLRRHVQG